MTRLENDETKVPHWRALESRRLIDDARALVDMAEGLRGRHADPPEPIRRSSSPNAVSRAVLVHAVSIDADTSDPSGSAYRGRRDAPDQAPSGASAARRPTPLIVLLDDAPRVPEFLPEGEDLDAADPTEEQIQRAIELRVRKALDRPLAEHAVLDILGSIQDAVMAIDRQRVLTYLNAAAVSLLQSLTRRTGPFVGEPLANAFPPAASATIAPAIHDALVHADASRVDDPERHRGLALDVSVFPDPHGATLVVRDATLRKDIEAELIETRVALSRAEAHLRALEGEGLA
jgi:PAS domain-containing protein